MGKNDDDITNCNRPGAPTFQEIVEARISRRGFLGGGLAAAAAFSMSGVGALLRAVPAEAAKAGNGKPHGPLIGFQPIDVSNLDDVVLPPGYSYKVLVAWGDPVSEGPAFKPDGSNSAAEQALQWGMHNDGLVYFPISGSARGLLVQNNEYADEGLLFTDGIPGWTEADRGREKWTEEKTHKSLAAHGVAIIEITKQGGRGSKGPFRPNGRNVQNGGEWQVVRPSKYARRITGNTPIKIAGPAAGDELLKTSADPTGTEVLGTLNNCAMGFTPWKTYLSCEENFNGFFFRTTSPDNRTALEKRYGISPFHSGLRWFKTHPRFNADTEPKSPIDSDGSSKSILLIPNPHR
jgi:secreted PhoX family phosphatase